MQARALGILHTLDQHWTTVEKEGRLSDLLREAEAEGTPGWFMHLPKSFNDSLDLRQTTRTKDGKASLAWTQGCNFAFKVGDMVYNSPKAYGPWLEALKLRLVAVQVRSVIEAGPQLLDSKIARRRSYVTFDVLLPTADRTQVRAMAWLTMTQSDFVRLLITGDGLPPEAKQ